MLVLGVALVVIGIVRILQGAGVIGGAPAEQASQQQGADQQQNSDKPEDKPSDASGGSNTASKVDESKAKTSKGLITLYGCAELDGEQLSKIIKDNDYDQITDEGATYLSPDTKNYGLFVSSGEKKENLGFKEVAKLKAGGEGTPVMYNIVVTGYKSAGDALKDFGNLDLEKLVATPQNIAVGIYTNAAGKRFLYAGHLNDNKTVGLLLYNEEALAAGYLPKLGKTVDEAYAALTAANAKKDGAAASEVPIDDLKFGNIS